MAEVLAAHDGDYVQDGYWFCDCGHEYGVFGGFGEAKAEHQTAMFTAAGFGPVKEAKAEALEEAADEPINEAHKTWLRARAAAVRGEG